MTLPTVVTLDSLVYGHATQDYRLRFALEEPRQFSVMDVDEDGDDTLDPPFADTGGGVIIPEFDGVTELGPLAGSVSGGGWTCALTIPRYPATFARYAGVGIFITPYYSNVAPAGEIVAFKGYMKSANPRREAGADTIRFTCEGSVSFLADNALSYGIDYYESADHAAPLAVSEAIGHMLDAHTNIGPRSAVVLGLPDSDLDALSVSAGDFASIIKGMASAVAIEGWLFARRDDTIWITAHPNYVREAYPNWGVSAMDFNDDMIFTVDVGDIRPDDTTASVTLTADTSDQDQLTSRAETALGLGGRQPISSLKYDDFDALDTLAPRALAHANRRYRAVKLTMPLNCGFDLGDLVTLTTEIPQYGISWLMKEFVVLDISHAFDLLRGTVTTTCTLDEIVDTDALLASGAIYLAN